MTSPDPLKTASIIMWVRWGLVWVLIHCRGCPGRATSIPSCLCETLGAITLHWIGVFPDVARDLDSVMYRLSPMGVAVSIPTVCPSLCFLVSSSLAMVSACLALHSRAGESYCILELRY